MHHFVRPLLLCALLILAVASTSCRSVHFYTQAARGQWEIMRRAEPVARVMADSATPQRVKDRLALVGELRAYAADTLRLPAERQYDRYTDLGRAFVVWVVYAAPEFSVEAKTWRYPILGELKYRGYFAQADAEREGARLRALGYDVDVSGTEAYSTLGWLRDPVLNTFLHRSDGELAELIFHELTHQQLYLKGDTDFNEALATAAGEAGARQWLRSKGRTAALRTCQRNQALQRTLIAAMLGTRERLRIIYTLHAAAPAATLRRLKTAELTRLRDTIRRQRRAAGVTSPMPSSLLNNASLNSVAAYYSLLPGFERLLASHHDDIPAFLRHAETMKPLSKAARRAVLGICPQNGLARAGRGE